LWLFKPISDGEKIQKPSTGAAMGLGAGIGLLSGLTGTGGGIYLTPLLLFLGWAKTKTASAVSAVFIMVNSIAGLAGVASSGTPMPQGWVLFAIAVVLGGSIGATLGSFRFPVGLARTLLSIVMSIAAAKLLLG
jgi:uncharacterized membrane protein YfcA